MTLTRILLVAILASSGSYWYLDRLKMERDYKKQMAVALAQQAKMKAGMVDALALAPRPAGAVDKGMIGFPSGYRPSTSPWDSVEKARYRSLFPANSFDVLVVPFQVQGYALDRSTRSLMFAQLSMELRAAGVKVPDSYPVLRALGENRRQFSPEQVYEFAHHLGVKRVIWTFAGHDRKNAMSFEFRIKEAERDGNFGGPVVRTAGRFDNVSFSSDSPPIVAYQALLPQIVEKLDYKPRAPSAKQASRFDGLALPSSPSGMVADPPDPARDAFYFLTFAALTPASAQRTRERFVEKAFLAALPLAEDYPDYRLLRARTFMLMGLRQAALHALGQPSTGEEKALAAMLDGNLPQVAAATPNVKPIVKKVLAELDLAVINHEYGVENKDKTAAAMKRLGSRGTVWPMFFARSLSDADYWAQFDNLPVKALLDAEFPIQGFTAEGIVSGAVALADPAKLQGSMDLSVYNHVKQVIEKDAAKLCCITDASHPSAQDYLDLVEAISSDNLSRRVNLISSVQGRPQDALVELGRLEAVYKGHPHFSLLRAQAESSAARKSDNAAKEGLVRSAYANLFDAFYYEQGQTADASEAFRMILQLNRTDFGNFYNVYVGDIPYRPSYPTWEYSNADLAMKNARDALDNSTIDTQPVYEMANLLDRKDAEFGEVLKSIEGRFAGSTYLAILRGNNKFRLGDRKAAEIAYREAIRSQPASWQPYLYLSRILLWDGRVEESAKLVKSYPGFSPGTSENAVDVANSAYEAGSDYFWTGHFDLARPLYTISANLRTGASSSMTSDSRLKLLAGDFAGALKGTYERATRYGASNAYRDYLAFLHAMGYSKEAWDGFNALVGQLSQPQIWESALVGHRLAGAPEQDILAWVNQDALRNAGDQSSYAANYLLRAVTTDRIPGELTAAAIGKFDRPVWRVTGTYIHTVKASADGHKHYVLGPSAGEGSYLPGGLFEQSEKVRVKSDLEYFAQAYRMLQTGDHEGARALLEETSELYGMGQASQAYMLPYLAFAAAKAKNTAGVEKLLAGFQPKQQQFDYFLAKAVILAIGGNANEAIPLLKTTLYKRPVTESRSMFTDYEYAEIVEWLYVSTKDVRYRALALDWARKCEKTQPWHAWAYAMEAKLSREGPDRRRAIAMAYYLDRNSERLKTVPKREIENAVKEFGPGNPFLKMREPKGEEKPT